ncbi:hypothetical protein [Micromonospora sp. NPDC049662]|uniref:hypothetical protein n=1 Tax=Micromonospora sp. NPDC049662 TaxID=3155397 RepID=UPI003424BA77
MSARRARLKRWDQWNRRPARVALNSRSRRQRFTGSDLDAVADTSLQAGRLWGHRDGERDLYDALACDFLERPDASPDDILDLAAHIGGQAMQRQLDDFLMVAAAAEADPEGVRRLAEQLLDGDEDRALWDSVPPATDDLLDVAESAGVTPGRAAEEARWWSETPPAADSTVVDLEAWLRERGRWIENFREHGEWPENGDAK